MIYQWFRSFMSTVLHSRYDIRLSDGGTPVNNNLSFSMVTGHGGLSSFYRRPQSYDSNFLLWKVRRRTRMINFVPRTLSYKLLFLFGLWDMEKYSKRIFHTTVEYRTIVSIPYLYIITLLLYYKISFTFTGNFLVLFPDSWRPNLYCLVFILNSIKNKKLIN